VVLEEEDDECNVVAFSSLNMDDDDDDDAAGLRNMFASFFLFVEISWLPWQSASKEGGLAGESFTKT
jgi:hypothetical protein